MPTQLERLAERCKGDVTLEINPHLGLYQDAGAYLGERDLSETDPRVTFEMVKRNRVVRVQFYPATPVGFFVVFHYDIEEALREAHLALDLERVRRKASAPGADPQPWCGACGYPVRSTGPRCNCATPLPQIPPSES